MKYSKYIRYIIRHKWYVMLECFREGLIWRGLMHDISKLLPSEFFAYAEFFYGKHNWERGSSERPPKHIDDKFDFSWLLHQKRNPHHWQYWIRYGDDGTTRTFQMPEPYLMEMICDWIGAGKAQGFFSPKDDIYLETRNWWSKNNSTMNLHPVTRKTIEIIIGIDDQNR